MIVIGAAGQLGSEICRIASNAIGVTHRQLDITDARAVDDFFATVAKNVVINCAAYNHVDRAEDEPELAFAVNAGGVLNLARACERAKSELIHVSTNYVFDGQKTEPYVESDAPNPLSVYGESKLAGERFALECGGVVARTSALIGDGDNFVKKIQRARSPKVVDDQFVSLSFCFDVAPAILGLVGESGNFHVVNDGVCSWFEFARAVRSDAAATTSVAQRAKRPRRAGLASTRLPALRHWRDALELFFGKT